MTLDGGSEKSEYVFISQFGRSFCLFSKAQNDSQRSLLFLKTFFFFFWWEKMSKALLDMGIFSQSWVEVSGGRNSIIPE